MDLLKVFVTMMSSYLLSNRTWLIFNVLLPRSLKTAFLEDLEGSSCAECWNQSQGQRVSATGPTCLISHRNLLLFGPYLFCCCWVLFCFFLKIFFFWCGSFLKSLLNLLQYCICFGFLAFGREACEILAPPPGIEPAPPALEGEVLTTGPPRKSLDLTFNNFNILPFEKLRGTS